MTIRNALIVGIPYEMDTLYTTYIFNGQPTKKAIEIKAKIELSDEQYEALLSEPKIDLNETVLSLHTYELFDYKDGKKVYAI